MTLPDGDLGINVDTEGGYSLPKYELYAYTEGKPNIIFLTGDVQPQYWGQFEVAEGVIDYVEKMGCKTVITIGGYGTRSKREVGIAYAIANDYTMLEELKGYDIQIAKSGIVRGAVGVVLGVAKYRKMRCLGLLGATRGLYPDIYAARTIVQIISSMYSLNIDLKDLDSEIEDMRKKMERLQEIQADVSRMAGEVAKKEPTGGYIA